MEEGLLGSVLNWRRRRSCWLGQEHGQAGRCSWRHRCTKGDTRGGSHEGSCLCTAASLLVVVVVVVIVVVLLRWQLLQGHCRRRSGPLRVAGRQRMVAHVLGSQLQQQLLLLLLVFLSLLLLLLGVVAIGSHPGPLAVVRAAAPFSAGPPATAAQVIWVLPLDANATSADAGVGAVHRHGRSSGRRIDSYAGGGVAVTCGCH